MFKVGLTGPMGSGKSFATKYFREAGIPVYDADATVHAIYRTPQGIAAVESAFGPLAATDADGPHINRKALAAKLAENPEVNIPRLEEILTPMIQAAEDAFTEQAEKSGAEIALYDVPLLYERGGYKRMDEVILMDAHPQLLRERVFKREGMTEAKYNLLQKRFIPQHDKKSFKPYIIDTNGAPEQSERQLDIVLTKLRNRANDKAVKQRNLAADDHTR